MLQRRMLLASGVATLCMPFKAWGKPQLSKAGSETSEMRMARAVRLALSPDDFSKALRDAQANGWCSGARPPLKALQVQIAYDFRAHDTVLVRGVMLSRTETIWLVSFEAGVA